jgi:hypothetical protein
MTSFNQSSRIYDEYLVRACFAVACLLLCLMITPAFAGAKPYEGVGTFGGVLKVGEVNEESQLGAAGALAVNYTGAGGVAKGTVYAAVHSDIGAHSGLQVARFEPNGAGLKFVERWQILPPSQEEAREGDALPPYEICGPAVAIEHLTGEKNCSMLKPGSAKAVGLAVDQSTGNVYFSREPGPLPEGEQLIAEYKANGSEVIARFGEQGPSGTSKATVAETPGKIHESPYQSPLAVNTAGEVFYFDLLSGDNFYHRLMVFKPKTPGDYSEYEYAGQSHDVGAGFSNESIFPTKPVLDAAGNVYIASDEKVQEYDPATPSSPICTFTYPQTGITALTVDPATGEPFFYTYIKRPRRIHELSSCENGVFRETGETEVAPERGELSALAFDPTRQVSASREPGVLYGVAPADVPPVGKGEPGTSALGYIFAQPEEKPPVVSAPAPENVTNSSAALSVRIDPNGFATHYVFRYLSRAEYLAQGESFEGGGEVPSGGAILSPAGGVQQLQATVSGLASDTDYVFQAVASSNCAPAEPTKVCTVESPAIALHTYANEAGGLPDGRAYELVSPPDKQGGQVYPANPRRSSCFVQCKPGDAGERFPMQSRPDGGAVVYEGEPFGPEGALIENQYLSRRTAAGWETTTLAPSLLANRGGSGYKMFDPALTVGVLGQATPALTTSTPGEYKNLYVQPTVDPASLTALLTANEVEPTCSPGTAADSLQIVYMGASTDLSRVFFEANDALAPEATGTCGQSNLYEWSAGALRTVNIPPAAAESIFGAVFGSGFLLQSGNSGALNPVIARAISEDGSRAFFTGEEGHLYVRIGETATLEVPGSGNCNKSTSLAARVCFLTASSDGSRVLLSDGQVYASNGGETAYEPSVDLTQGKGGFLGIVGQSEDLSHLYFVDTADLTGAEENDQGSVAEAGKKNLYTWIEGTTRFVAVLASVSEEDRNVWAAAPGIRTAEASPNGRWLAFQNAASLTGYDNVGPCELAQGTLKVVPCQEVFVYDSQTHVLACASCNPSGSRPAGPSASPTYRFPPGHLPQPRYLNDAGRLFFDTSDRLVPGDTNARVEDVYEYEPTGLGGCSQADHCLRLISSGRGSVDSNFLTTDATGDNVFFTTRARLVKADRDELIDLYDARVGGGFTEAQPPAECKGEACQQATAVPPQSAPPSMGLGGEGNATAPGHACKKAQVKRKGRCVKKHKHKAKNHHKHGTRHARKGGNR